MSFVEQTFYENLWTDAVGKIHAARELAGSPMNQIAIVEKILAQREGSIGLSSEDAATLLQAVRSGLSPVLRQTIISSARALRQEIFGNKVSTMVPIEIGSYCMSSCQFCGWRSDNKKMLRLKITNEALVEQAKMLSLLGFSHFEISMGDDLNYIKNELPQAIQLLKSVAQEAAPDARVSICLTPLHEHHYNNLAQVGLDTVLTWQETYSPSVFKKYVVSGPKANGITADFKVAIGGDGRIARMKSHESAVRAGLQVGIGVMIGLSDEPEADILSVIMHGQKLIENYRESIQPLIIGMPTWNPITTHETDNLSQHQQAIDAEDSFELISAIYLLSFPDQLAWVFPNCRVSRKTQIESILTAGCFTSTMVRVGPGAYLSSKPPEELQKLFERSSKELSSLDQKMVLGAEQFKHHFGDHKSYVDAFEARGLTVVPDQVFIESARQAIEVV